MRCIKLRPCMNGLACIMQDPHKVGEGIWRTSHFLYSILFILFNNHVYRLTALSNVIMLSSARLLGGTPSPV